ncbi:MAG: 16S rRNA (uracil(1498)-N(3))-methyltransferase [Paludibacteraceae bacterium]|nr:16S rRNA (uracil(1498)-N(3))-methyltransferase [Paludibacteraceae bacterium]
MNLFYAPDIISTQCLPEEESNHCVQVLRQTAGDRIVVTDGTGHLYHCTITNPHRKHCEVCIDRIETPAPLHTGHIHIAVAPTKNIDRLEWAIEKCTEMGVDELTPVLCEHSERKTVNNDRLQKIIVAAAKQSLKTTFPLLNPMTRLTELHAEGDKFIAHCMTDEEGDGLQTPYRSSDSKHALQNEIVKGNTTTVLIGPEGDFSPAELEWALANGFVPVSLGAARLRTETAAVAACHTAVLLNE